MGSFIMVWLRAAWISGSLQERVVRTVGTVGALAGVFVAAVSSAAWFSSSFAAGESHPSSAESQPETLVISHVQPQPLHSKFTFFMTRIIRVRPQRGPWQRFFFLPQGNRGVGMQISLHSTS